MSLFGHHASRSDCCGWFRPVALSAATMLLIMTVCVRFDSSSTLSMICPQGQFQSMNKFWSTNISININRMSNNDNNNSNKSRKDTSRALLSLLMGACPQIWTQSNSQFLPSTTNSNILDAVMASSAWQSLGTGLYRWSVILPWILTLIFPLILSRCKLARQSQNQTSLLQQNRIRSFVLNGQMTLTWFSSFCWWFLSKGATIEEESRAMSETQILTKLMPYSQKFVGKNTSPGTGRLVPENHKRDGNEQLRVRNNSSHWKVRPPSRISKNGTRFKQCASERREQKTESSTQSCINWSCIRIPEQCDICLEDYQEGDRICGSPNPQCVHIFHLSCVARWLALRQHQHYKSAERGKRKMDCPCCRQDYL